MIEVEQHPLVGTILRQVDRPWDRFKIVSVASGSHQCFWWVSPGKPENSNPRQAWKADFEWFEIDSDQTDGPINRPMPNGKLPPA